MKASKISTVAFLFASTLLNTSFTETNNAMEKTPLELAAAEYDQVKNNPGYVDFSVPDQNPGPPFYARIAVQGPDKLFLNANGTVVVPFIRNPDCIDSNFNLLDLFHIPNAFSCPLNATGKGLVERNAPPKAAPLISYLESKAMPVWFFDSEKLSNAMADGKLTIDELKKLNPKKGIASRYIEYNKPRPDKGYLLVIEMDGHIPETNQTFKFSVDEVNRVIKDIHLNFK